ncbi:TRAP transporter substrate-binding protein [Candidatus Kaiserbacteria bacterium]|nr:TRAP transporter substrate-binding protein [Candidatus Kaiserbacteria bacterium]
MSEQGNTGQFSAKRLLVYLGILVVCALLLLFGWNTFASSAQKEPAAKAAITWLLPHPPTVLFARAADVFSKEISVKSGGDVSLERTVLPDDVLPPSYTTGHDFTAYIDSETPGHPRMISEYVGHLGGTYSFSVRVLDLPFLFDDYDSALKFLDGPGGEKLLNDLALKIPKYKPLAFTMSGGFRIFVSKDKKILTPEDMKGMEILSGAGGPVIQGTTRALGANPVQDPKLEFTPDLVKLKTADAVETTYSRLAPLLEANPTFIKYVTETNHSMSLTIVLVSTGFYDSLSPKDQTALKDAVHDAAVAEKQDNIAYEDSMRALLEKNGTTIIRLTPEQRNVFKEALAPLRKELDPQFDGLVEEIQSGLKAAM